MKPSPKPEPERKVPPVPIGDVCKNAEGFFTGVGHPTNMACVKIPLNWPYFNGYTVIPDGMYPVIRVDGHCFHTFTRKLKKPFDPAMVKAMQSLVGLIGVPKEDAANILPLGMESKMVWKGNLRMLINFMNRRLCTRALKEIRGFANEFKKLLASVDDEWAWIAENLFVPSCEQYKIHNPEMKFCVEEHCCGRAPRITELKVSKDVT